MKIRIRGQSVRLRLGRTEVAALARGEAVEEVARFGSAARFGCVIRPRPGGDVIACAFADGLLTFRVPSDRLSAWALTDAVGFEGDLPLDDGRTLRLLVEKDFACIEPGGQPDTDAYPNPSAACG